MTTRAVAMALAVLTLVGCGDVIRIGRLADTSRLEAALKPGLSSRDDVLRELGAPRSSGAALLPGWDRPRETWFYLYEEGGLTDFHRCYIYVFFDGAKYDGYLWFSSLGQP